MGLIERLIDLLLHLDKHLNDVIGQYGHWTYLILFLIVFCETGLVVTPILPGDSLLFAAGAVADLGSLNVLWLFVLLAIAAVVGDTVNYWVGYWVGPKVFHRENVRFLKRKHLDQTHQFYEKYGGKTIIIARFIPIVRTFAPFVAGIGRMRYARFFSFNVVGALGWVGLMVIAGQMFGELEVVKKRFHLVIFAIIF